MRYLKSFSFRLNKGMSQQRKNPLPSLSSLSLDSFDYDTDIDSEGIGASSLYLMPISQMSN